MSLTLCLLILTTSAQAQDSSFTFQAGFGHRGEDAIYAITVGYQISKDDFQLKIVAPWVAYLENNAPQNPESSSMRLVDSLYDQPDDYLRWIKQFQLGKTGQGPWFEASVLSHTRLGQGLLVDTYYSAIDQDKCGVAFRAAYIKPSLGSFELWVVNPVDPQLIASQATLYPLAMLNTNNAMLRSLQVSFEGVLDPTSVELGQPKPLQGIGATVALQTRIFKDSGITPKLSTVWYSAATSLFLGAEFVSSWGQTNYLKKFSLQADIAFTNGWIVPIGPLYSLERQQFPLVNPQPQSRLETLEQRKADHLGIASRINAKFTWLQWMQTSVGWLYQPMLERNDIVVRLDLAVLHHASIAGLIIWRQYEHAFTPIRDEAILAAVETVTRISGPFTAFTRIGYWFRENQENQLQQVWDWQIGIGYDLHWN